MGTPPVTDPPSDSVRQLQDGAALDAFVSDAGIALVEFYTEGCGICQSMEPVLGNLARELDVAIGTVNPRTDPPLIEQYDVRSVPLFVLFVEGEPKARRSDGFIAGDDLTEWVREHAGSAGPSVSTD